MHTCRATVFLRSYSTLKKMLLILFLRKTTNPNLLPHWSSNKCRHNNHFGPIDCSFYLDKFILTYIYQKIKSVKVPCRKAGETYVDQDPHMCSIHIQFQIHCYPKSNRKCTLLPNRLGLVSVNGTLGEKTLQHRSTTRFCELSFSSQLCDKMICF